MAHIISDRPRNRRPSQSLPAEIPILARNSDLPQLARASALHRSGRGMQSTSGLPACPIKPLLLIHCWSCPKEPRNCCGTSSHSLLLRLLGAVGILVRGPGRLLVGSEEDPVNEVILDVWPLIWHNLGRADMRCLCSSHQGAPSMWRHLLWLSAAATPASKSSLGRRVRNAAAH